MKGLINDAKDFNANNVSIEALIQEIKAAVEGDMNMSHGDKIGILKKTVMLKISMLMRSIRMTA